MKKFKAFVIKEFKHVFRDSKTLMVLFILPPILVILFGFALSNEIKNSNVVIVDTPNNTQSKHLIHKINANHYFTVIATVNNAKKIERFFKRGKATIALVIPKGAFRLRNVTLQIIVDSSNPNAANTVLAYLIKIIRNYSYKISLYSKKLGVKPQIKMLYNPQLKGALGFVPGVITLVFLLISILMTSVSIVKEKELGSFKSLIISPMQPLAVIIAKVIPYFLISAVNFILILLLSIYILKLPFNGSFLLLFFTSTVFIFTSLSLGVLVSILTKSQQEAIIISIVIFMVPSIIFTGFMYPIDNMPPVLQLISNLFPGKFYYQTVIAIMIKETGVSTIWISTLILCLFSVISLFLSVLLFNRVKQ